MGEWRQGIPFDQAASELSEGHVGGSGEQPRLGERLGVTEDVERWLRQGQPERRRRPGLGRLQHCRDEPRLPTREADGGPLENRRKPQRTSWEGEVQERRARRCPELERAYL